jgi:hypothetical protein
MNEGTLAYVQYISELEHLDISGLKITMYEYMATVGIRKVVAHEVGLKYSGY